MAMRIPAGCVVINDMIAPTADPRIPFGGAGESGYGVTRGAAGLEEMTRIKAIVEQRSKWLPHLDPTSPHDADLLAGFAQFTHGETMFGRMAGLRRLITAAMAQRKWAKDN
jgi:aldehyde dehydrogenase (NAD+)